MVKWFVCLFGLFLVITINASAQGSITTTTCPGVGCQVYPVNGAGTARVQITGTFSGTISFESTVDNSNFDALVGIKSGDTTFAPVTTTTTTGTYSFTVAAASAARIKFSSWVSGTAILSFRTVTAAASRGGSGGGGGNIGGSIANTQVAFGTAVNTIGGDSSFLYNSTTHHIALGTSLDANRAVKVVENQTPAGNFPVSSGIYRAEADISPLGNQSGSGSFRGFSSNLTGSGSNNTRALFNYYGEIINSNTGTLNFQYGVEEDLINDSSGNVTDSYPFYSYIENSGSGNIAFAGGFTSDIINSGGGTISNAYQFYGSNLMGSATNPYFLWYDGGAGSDCNSGGVYRVNQFGIPAYYNPCFVKYTPGLANFERLINRWGDTGVFGVDNRAYLGVEIGGTGTARPVNLIGANYSITSTLTPAVTNTSANSCGTTTATLVGNDNAGKVTVGATSGSSCTITFATAFLNAPSCFVTNETTANLSRAISTTSTAILTGVFIAGDTLAYMCMGR